ncbi:ABC transporter ATP-binding protein [Nocardia aurantia]|uniref:Putative ABC transporter ATP-binding protein n=1 Tax=Nocardia aurantia TaxID=2585199 RepID=A0A7K0E1F0_9NOCA|nr:ABC transporter ATP-binding protein [Nocardia aurantia]MQY31899.1 putative ABC transporter ATP-binding protein [Nocardia aurantia]
MTAPLLEIDDLRVSFGGTPAVRGVGLTLAPGERVAVVGASGSGKSTLAHAVLGLLPGSGRITGGRIAWRGTEITHAPERRMRALRGREIGLVPQDPMSNLNPVTRVGTQVSEALVAHRICGRREASGRAAELLGRAGIPDPERRARQYPHEFSGGMRQRVLIAIALACRPHLLIADEPTSALDVTVQRRILDSLTELTHDLGTTLLLVTHDLGLAAERADRVLVMSDGHIVESGPARTVLTTPHHAYTRRLVAAAPAAYVISTTPAGGPDRTAARIASTSTGADPTPAVGTGPDAGAAASENAAPASTVGTEAAADRNARRVSAVGTAGTGPTAVRAADRTAADPPLLEVRDVRKEFRLRDRGGLFAAVDSVSFTIGRGRTTAIVGESGSGKTTVAHMVLGLVTPTTGSIHLEGVDLAGRTGDRLRAARRAMQPVFQDPYASLDPMWTVRRLIAEPLRAFGIGDRPARRARVAELLDQVALPAVVARRHPHELSGGQRQRVAIARALAADPPLVVCDEPVSALDVLVQDQILTLLADLQQRLGLSYLFISHDLAVVRAIAHEVLVMRDGRVVESGPTAEILTTPADPYTRGLLDAIPGAAGPA